MVATPIAGSNRYIPEGVTKFYWVATIATYTAPSRGELNAGTDLSPEIANSGDWAITANALDTPDLVTTFTPQIPGKITMGTTTIDMYADPAGTDARTLMPRGAVGFIVKFLGGDITGRKMDVFPVKVGSTAKPVALGGTANIITFSYYVTKIPAEDVAVP